MANIFEKLMKIQTELKAPKGQYNTFGSYSYRSCEDILEGLKPLLEKHKATVTISDEIEMIGDRYYVKATATIIDVEKGEKVETSAYAREDATKKGMDLSQLTGSTSSYARKYALNGLFAIDDTKDSDYTNTHDKGQQDKPKTNQQSKDKQSSLATQSQLNLMYKLVKEKNYGNDSISSYIKNAYGKDNSKELTKKEASTIINMLNGLEGVLYP